MPKICYTATQVKLVKSSLIFMTGIILFQAITIRRITSEFGRGQQRFHKLHEGANYLLDKIQDNGLELTEFDVIALTSILEDGSNGKTAS